MAKVTKFTIEFVSIINEDTTPPSILAQINSLPDEKWADFQKQACEEMINKYALEIINKDNTWAKIEVANV